MPTCDPEIRASLFLSHLRGLNGDRRRALFIFFGSAEAAVAAGPGEWRGLQDFELFADEVAADWDLARRDAENDERRSEAEKVALIPYQSDTYPPLLKNFFDPPMVLYVKGDASVLREDSVALVGSRRCSYYGESVARAFAAELAGAGVHSVSGLARGIDTAAHSASLKAGGKTIAVIGSGLSKIYPPENKKLAEQISHAGAVVSELPMDARPFPANFPKRNRIIAGISLGTVVIEGSFKSGALITARLAAEEGREVFAVPGPILSPLSYAPNRLIQTGAKLVRSVMDIFEEIPALSKKIQASLADAALLRAASPQQQLILDAAGAWPVSRDMLADRTKLETSALGALLLEMEISGLIRSVAGGFIVANPVKETH